MEIITG